MLVYVLAYHIGRYIDILRGGVIEVDATNVSSVAITMDSRQHHRVKFRSIFLKIKIFENVPGAYSDRKKSHPMLTP